MNNVNEVNNNEDNFMLKTKRIAASVMALLMLLNLSACGGKTGNTNMGLSDRRPQKEFKGKNRCRCVSDYHKTAIFTRL